MRKRVTWHRFFRATGVATGVLVFAAGTLIVAIGPGDMINAGGAICSDRSNSAGSAGALLQSRTYVGADQCASCHAEAGIGGQHGKWASTLHAKSLNALTGPNAFYAANAAGVKEPAKDPKCLRCHAPLFEKSPEFAREGVTCEICHGPGSGYAERSVMADRGSAVRNGLVDYQGSLNMIMAYCLDCHNTPHGNPMEFSGAWEKIKHPRPNINTQN